MKIDAVKLYPMFFVLFLFIIFSCNDIGKWGLIEEQYGENNQFDDVDNEVNLMTPSPNPTSTPTPEPTPTPTPEPTVTPLFEDDFEDGNADGWTVESGTFSVINDGGNMVYEYPSLIEGLVMAGDIGWTDYSVEAKIKPIDLNGNKWACLCGRYQDDRNFYSIGLKGNGSLDIRKKIDGSSTTLSSTSYTFNINTWYTVKLEMNGSNLKAYINGVLEAETTDSDLASGAIGLFPFEVAAQYDDIIVLE